MAENVKGGTTHKDGSKHLSGSTIHGRWPAVHRLGRNPAPLMAGKAFAGAVLHQTSPPPPLLVFSEGTMWLNGWVPSP